MYLWPSIALLGFLLVHQSDAHLDLAEAFKEFKQDAHGDILPSPPPKLMKVKFGSGEEVNLGNELAPRSIRDKPTHLEWEHEPGKLYTLMLVDPDAPARTAPIFRSYNHWLVANIPGNDIAKGLELREFHRSAPPRCTGLHRYLYLVWEQQRGPATRHYTTRINFQPQDYATRHGLKLVAGNWHQSQWDSSLPGAFIPCF